MALVNLRYDEMLLPPRPPHRNLVNGITALKNRVGLP